MEKQINKTNLSKTLLYMLVLGGVIIILSIFKTSAQTAEQVWAIDESYKVKPFLAMNPDGIKNEFFSLFVGSGYERGKDYSKKNSIWDAENKKISLSAAQNEYISFQIIIEAKDYVLKNINLEASSLEKNDSAISKDNLKFFKENYTKIEKWHSWSYGGTTGLGEYPDALIPFDISGYGAPFGIERGRNQAIWVDLYIPEDTSPGVYKGKIKIYGDNLKETILNLELTVWNFTLPDESHLPFWTCVYPGSIKTAFGMNWSDMDKPRFKEIEKKLWKLCQEHRLTAMSRRWYSPRYRYNPGRKISALDVDWNGWDERMKSYIDGSLFENKAQPPILILPLSGGAEGRWPKWGDGGDPDGLFQEMCKAFKEHLLEIGWDPKKKITFIYLCDEKGPETHPSIIKDIKLIKEVTPEFRVGVWTWSSDAFYKAFAGLKEYIDLCFASGEGFEVKTLQNWRNEKPGRLIGLYHSDGDPKLGRDSLDSEGLAIRTWPWVAWEYKIDALYMYIINATHNHAKDNYELNANPFLYPYTQYGPGQGIWVYPGRWIGVDEYLSSIRLKQVRRGMQDYEYLWLASQKASKEEVDKVVNKIIGSALSESKPIKKGRFVYGNWSHNPEDWYKARIKLAEMILR